MSKPIDDGGSAFPGVIPETAEHGAFVAGYAQGMTKREWFAGQALPAMIRHFGPNETAAVESYRMAEIMLFSGAIKRPFLNIDEVALGLARVINEIPPVTAFLGGSAQRVSHIQIKITKVLKEVVNHG